MTERDRIIYGFSDVELLRFHEIGGRVPVSMRPRLNALLGFDARRLLPEVRYALENLTGVRMTEGTAA